MKTFIIIDTQSIVYFYDAYSYNQVREYCREAGIRPWAIKLA